MARGREQEESGAPPMISIIGPGMHVYGDCVADGTIRIEGAVTGTVYGGKAVVVGPEGVVVGDVRTQDAVISGVVTGTVTAASRLEVQATARIEGEVHTRRLQLEEGAILNGEVRMGEVDLGPPPSAEHGEPAGEVPHPVPEEADAALL